MSLRRPRFEEEEAAQAINISPLIDVIFILLIFFIVTMVFADGNNLRLDIPQSSQTEAPQNVGANVSISADGEIWFEGKHYDFNDLERILRVRLAGENKVVVLRSDSNVSVRRLVELMDCVKASGAKDIYVAAKTK